VSAFPLGKGRKKEALLEKRRAKEIAVIGLGGFVINYFMKI
jgi:hypothetical protein